MAERVTLADWLGPLYAESHGLGEVGAFEQFLDALQRLPDLRQAARAEWERLDALANADGMGGNLDKRCVMSSTARTVLRRALDAVGA